MSDGGSLWTPHDLSFTGMASYYDTAPGASTRDLRIYLQVEIGDGQVEFLAMVDTAASSSRLSPER